MRRHPQRRRRAEREAHQPQRPFGKLRKDLRRQPHEVALGRPACQRIAARDHMEMARMLGNAGAEARQLPRRSRQAVEIERDGPQGLGSAA
jgi:hypothetical protein